MNSIPSGLPRDVKIIHSKDAAESFEKKEQLVAYPGAEEAIKQAEAIGIASNPVAAEKQEVVQTKKEDVQKAGGQSVTEIKEKNVAASSLLSRVFAHIRRALSSLNIFAYFNKNQDQDYIKATPEQLSAATKKLYHYLMENKDKIFKQEGIFRKSVGEVEKKKLFNQLIRSPKQDLPADLDPHLAAVAFKKVCADLNLFASNDSLVKKFKEAANQLSSRPSPDQSKVIEILKELKAGLSPERMEDLKNFIDILRLANQQEDVNRMTIDNLAIVAGPNLCDIDILDFSEAVSFSANRQEVARQFIVHYNQIFAD